MRYMSFSLQTSFVEQNLNLLYTTVHNTLRKGTARPNGLHVQMNSTSISAPRPFGSALGRLHYILKLEKRVVCRLRILRIHLRVQIVGDRAAPNNSSHRIVDIHDLAGWHRCNRLPESRIDGLEVALCQHPLRIHTLDGLNVGLGSLLEGRTVHG